MSRDCPLCGGPLTYEGLTSAECGGARDCPNYNPSTAATQPNMPAANPVDWVFDLDFPFPLYP